MPLVRRRRVPLPLEHVAQVPAALGADDLRARHAERAVGVAGDGAGEGVEVGGPAAAGFELVRGAVERGGAGGAGLRVDELMNEKGKKKKRKNIHKSPEPACACRIRPYRAPRSLCS